MREFRAPKKGSIIAGKAESALTQCLAKIGYEFQPGSLRYAIGTLKTRGASDTRWRAVARDPEGEMVTVMSLDTMSFCASYPITVEQCSYPDRQPLLMVSINASEEGNRWRSFNKERWKEHRLKGPFLTVP